MQPSQKERMEHLNLTDIEAFFQPTLDDQKFNMVKEQNPESTFGATRTYENGALQLTFVIDRGHPYHYVQSVDSGPSLSLDSVYHWLTGERPSTEHRSKVEPLAALLATRYTEVIQAVCDDGAKVAAEAERFNKEWLRRWRTEASSPQTDGAA